MKRLYFALCKRWGPNHLTFSAYAWQRFAVTGDTWLRDRIDGLMLFWCSEHNHCQAQWQRETRGL